MESTRMVVIDDDTAAAGDLDEGLEQPLRRPRTRGECVDGPRPCPWFSCRHHLGLDLEPHPTRRKRTHSPLRVLIDPDELDDGTETCSLDIADGGPLAGQEFADVVRVPTNLVERTLERALEAFEDAAERLGPELLEDAA